MIRITVTLNGTDKNPYLKWGLTQNPIPQIARHEYNDAIRRIQALAGEPIPDTAYIRKMLEGFSDEFIQLCCDFFRKGERVTFDVTFPE